MASIQGGWDIVDEVGIRADSDEEEDGIANGSVRFIEFLRSVVASADFADAGVGLELAEDSFECDKDERDLATDADSLVLLGTELPGTDLLLSSILIDTGAPLAIPNLPYSVANLRSSRSLANFHSALPFSNSLLASSISSSSSAPTSLNSLSNPYRSLTLSSSSRFLLSTFFSSRNVRRRERERA